MTLGKPVIMGRKTLESIGKPLDRRLNLVVSRDATLAVAGAASRSQSRRRHRDGAT